MLLQRRGRITLSPALVGDPLRQGGFCAAIFDQRIGRYLSISVASAHPGVHARRAMQVTYFAMSVYRAIFAVFARAKRQHRLQLRPDEVLAEARWPGAPPNLEKANAALVQLPPH
jgi:putative hemolysin